MLPSVTWVGCFASQRVVAMALSVCREQMESQLEKEARFRQLMAHSSHDSAIDTDSMEWETEVVEFERDTVNCPHLFPPPLFNIKTLEEGRRAWTSWSAPTFQGCWLEGQLFLPGCRCFLFLHLSKLSSSRLHSCVMVEDAGSS